MHAPRESASDPDPAPGVATVAPGQTAGAEPTTQQEPTVDPEPARPKAKVSISHSEIMRDAFRGVLFALAIVLLRLPFDRAEPVNDFRLLAYNITQHVLAANAGQAFSVAVVDISQYSNAEPVGKGDAAHTPREPLKNLIKVIAKGHPRAIGIDIDFSPDQNGYIDPNDPNFFQFCQSIKKTTGVPVFLGVERTAALQPDYWLGNSDYADLAASLVVPNGRTQMLYTWTQVGGDATPCITMAAALARADYSSSDKQGNRVPRWLKWALEERIPQTLPRGVRAEGFVVDYGHLAQLSNPSGRIAAVSLFSTDSAALSKEFQNRVALIGDATAGLTGDQFVVADYPSPVPGTLLHACAADTLIRAPLYDFTFPGRLAIDLTVASIIVFTVAALRWREGESETVEALGEQLHKHHLAVTWVVVSTALVIGILQVYRTRVLWDDFPFVVVGLFSHRPAEKWFNATIRKVRRFMRRRPHGRRKTS